jgi:hypothetical protein
LKGQATDLKMMGLLQLPWHLWVLLMLELLEEFVLAM